MGNINFRAIEENMSKDLQSVTEEIKTWIKGKGKNYFTIDEIVNAVLNEGAPYKLLYYVLNYSSVDGPDKIKVINAMDIQNSKNTFWSMSIKDSENVFESYNIKNSNEVSFSAGVFDSAHVRNSSLIESSNQVNSSTLVKHSDSIDNSENIHDSLCVFKSKYIWNSKFVSECEKVTQCVFCDNCTNLKNALFCAFIRNEGPAPDKYYIFNTEVTKEDFERAIEGLSMFKVFFSPNYCANTIYYKEREALIKYIKEMDTYYEGLFNYIMTKVNRYRI